MTKKTAASYSLEVRERAVRLVLEGGGDHPTQWAKPFKVPSAQPME